jgi:hypothetical protein
MSEARLEGCGATIGAFIAGALLGGMVCFIVGGIIGQKQLQHARYTEERQAVEPALQKDPAFKAVEINEYTGGGIYLTGRVVTEADKKRLEEALTRAIGETRANLAALAVSVEKKSPTEPNPSAKPHRE